MKLLTLFVGVRLVLGGPVAWGGLGDDAWQKLSVTQRGLYTQLTKTSGKTERDVQTQFNLDIVALRENRHFHCDSPYRYRLFKKAGLISNKEAADRERFVPCSQSWVLPFSSTDTEIVGHPLSFSQFDPSQIVGIKIGKTKVGTLNFGHSFVTFLICRVPGCTRPIEISAHPGMNKQDGKLVYSPRNYVDVLAANELKEDLTVEEVPLDISNPEYKQNFLAAFYERLIQQDSKYSLFNNNCSTQLDDLLALADMKPKSRFLSITPEGVLVVAEQQSGKKRQVVLSAREKGEQLVRELGLAQTFDSYKNQKPQERYCSRYNPNGVLKVMVDSTDASAMMGSESLFNDLLGSFGESSSYSMRMQRVCERAQNRTDQVFDRVQKCAKLENYLLFGKKVELNKLLRNSSHFSTFQQQATVLAAKRKELIQLVISVSHRINGRGLDRPELLRRLRELDHQNEGQAIANQINRLSDEVDRMSKEILMSYEQILAEYSGVGDPFELARRYQAMVKSSFVGRCYQGPFCPSRSNP